MKYSPSTKTRKNNQSSYGARKSQNGTYGVATTIQLKDNRPEIILQRKLQKMANSMNTDLFPVQKKSSLEEEELLQGKFATTQKQDSIKHQKPDIVQRVPIDYTLTEGIDHPVILAGGIRLQFDTSNGNEARKYLDLMITNYRITIQGKYLISQAIRRSGGANNFVIADRLRLLAWFDHKYGIKMEDVARGGVFEPELGPDL